MTDAFDLAAAVRIGTRASDLAIRQASAVAEKLVAGGLYEGYELVRIGEDGGDPSASGGGSVQTAALRAALVDGRCDLVVHMLKDLPLAPFPGLETAAYLTRGDPREALCARGGRALADLAPGARVAVSSALRKAQLRRLRSDLNLVGIRGPVESRLARMGDGEFDATLLAMSVLTRLDRATAVTEVFDQVAMLPTPGLAISVVEVREDARPQLKRTVGRLDHLSTRLAALAERTLQARLAGVSAPAGAYARLVDDDVARSRLVLTGLVCATGDGGDVRLERSTVLDEIGTRADVDRAVAQAIRLGEDVARALLAAGAGDLGQQVPTAKAPAHRPRVMLPRGPAKLNAKVEKALRDAGAEPVFVTLTTLIPSPVGELDAILDRLRRADRVGFTSPEAVMLLDERAHARGGSLAGVLEHTPVVAFGGIAGTALVNAAVTVDMLPSVDVSVNQLREVWRPVDKDAPLAILPGSANASPALAKALRELEWRVEGPAVYRRVTAEPSREHEQVLADGWPDVVVITTRSVAKAIEELFGMPPAGVKIVAAGRIPAADARDLGLAVDRVCQSAQPSSLLDAILAVVRD